MRPPSGATDDAPTNEKLREQFLDLATRWMRLRMIYLRRLGLQPPEEDVTRIAGAPATKGKLIPSKTGGVVSKGGAPPPATKSSKRVLSDRTSIRSHLLTNSSPDGSIRPS